MPGVAAVYTADDLRIAPQTPSGNVEARERQVGGAVRPDARARRGRYVGEAVAVVIADTLATGRTPRSWSGPRSRRSTR